VEYLGFGERRRSGDDAVLVWKPPAIAFDAEVAQSGLAYSVSS
jgi:hypothetical protein